MKSKHRNSSKLTGPSNDELNLCRICTGVALFGNVWLVLMGVPTLVLLAYASASGAFALVANLTAVVRWAVKRA